MQDTANTPRAPGPPDRAVRCTFNDDDDAQGALDPARLRALLDRREAATRRFRALKHRLLGR